jgi:hypothetical protein
MSSAPNDPSDGTGNTCRKVAFLCESLSTAPSEFIPLAAFLKDEGMESVLFFPNMSLARYGQLKQSGLRFYVGPEDGEHRPRPGKDAGDQIGRPPGAGRRLRAPYVVRSLPLLFLELFRLARLRSSYERILEREGFDCLVLYTDRTTGITQPLISAARKHGVPIVGLQVARTVIDRIAHNRLKKRDYYAPTLAKRFLRRRSPGQVRRWDDRDLHVYKDHEALAMLWLGMLPAQPWHNCESWCDVRLLISEKNRQEEMAEGASCRTAKVIGQFSLDKLHDACSDREQTRQEMMNKYFPDSQPTREIIVLALPQLYEHRVMSDTEAMAEIDAVLGVLDACSGKKTFVSLHPKMSYERYETVNRRYANIRVVKEERLSNFMPIGRYFVGAFPSTLTWCFYCELVPVFLNYFALGFDVSDYPAVLEVRSRDALKDVLERAFQGRETILKTMTGERDRLAPFDGRAGQRIVNELHLMSAVKNDGSPGGRPPESNGK